MSDPVKERVVAHNGVNLNDLEKDTNSRHMTRLPWTVDVVTDTSNLWYRKHSPTLRKGRKFAEHGLRHNLLSVMRFGYNLTVSSSLLILFYRSTLRRF